MINECLSICRFFSPESQEHLTNQENYTLSCILGCTLGQDAILACKPLFALFFKQSTVYVENMILAFEEDSVLSMISHVP